MLPPPRPTTTAPQLTPHRHGHDIRCRGICFLVVAPPRLPAVPQPRDWGGCFFNSLPSNLWSRNRDATVGSSSKWRTAIKVRIHPSPSPASTLPLHHFKSSAGGPPPFCFRLHQFAPFLHARRPFHPLRRSPSRQPRPQSRQAEATPTLGRPRCPHPPPVTHHLAPEGVKQLIRAGDNGFLLRRASWNLPPSSLPPSDDHRRLHQFSSTDAGTDAADVPTHLQHAGEGRWFRGCIDWLLDWPP